MRAHMRLRRAEMHQSTALAAVLLAAESLGCWLATAVFHDVTFAWCLEPRLVLQVQEQQRFAQPDCGRRRCKPTL